MDDLLLKPSCYDRIRSKLSELPNRTPEDHEIQLKYHEFKRANLLNNGQQETKFQLAELVIKSGSRNALSGRMICQLTDRLDELDTWLKSEDNERSQGTDLEAKCLLLRGHDETFCSGSDLVGVRQTLDYQTAKDLALLMQYNLARLERLPLVSVAFIEGYALGGGAEILLAADMRLMSDSARVGYVHARNGICCGWGGGSRLVELLGRARTMELLSSGRLIRAEEAQLVGLCQGRANNLEEAIEFTLKHCIESRRTCRAVKQLINSSGRMSFAETLDLESELIASTWGQEAHLRALNINLKHQ